MELTGRGKKAVLSILIVGAFSLMFLDGVLLILDVILVGLLSYDYVGTRETIGKLPRLVGTHPTRIEGELTAGEIYSSEISVKSYSRNALELRCPLEGAELAPEGRIETGSVEDFEYSFQPDLAGEYEMSELIGRVRGALGLWMGEEGVPLKQRFQVRPRVLAAAIRAAQFLEAAGRSGFGDQPTDIKGTGLEYAGSREYQVGDELRHMDWKATARLNRPIIKEYYIEGGLGVHLVHEVGAPDPVSFDKLSTSFINTALALARRTIPFGVTVFEEGKVHLHVNRAEPRVGLALAMRQSLRTAEAGIEDLYRVLEPRTSRQVRRIVQSLESETIKTALSGSISSGGEKTKPYKALEETVRSFGGRFHLVFNSSLAGDIKQLLELEDFARMKNCEIMVLQPTTPWKNLDSLEDRYEARDRYDRIHGIMKNRGIPVSGSVERLVEQIASESLAVKQRL